MFDRLKQMGALAMVITLIIVVAVIAGIVWAVRKMKASWEGMVDESDTMKYARLAELMSDDKATISAGVAERMSHHIP